MTRIFTLFAVTLFSGLQVASLPAQRRGAAVPPTAREPARVGLLGGLRDARDERFRREAQTAAAVARAAAGPAQRNPNLNPLNNPLISQQSVASANRAAANNAAVANNLLRREPTTGSTTALNPYQRSVDAARAGYNGRTANYGSPHLQSSNAINSNNGSTRLAPSSIVSASANALVPNPVTYEGPGVAVRLPPSARGVVNYLVDDLENNEIHPGEVQVLDAKGSFVVRYSRGVTADGRSFGESRYTITEGQYRFELTETGWELYREADSDAHRAPLNRLDFADNFVEPRPSSPADIAAVANSSLNELPLPSVGRNLQTESLATEQPEMTLAPAANEEVLPSPKSRSILE